MSDTNKLSQYVLKELQANRIDKSVAISLIKKLNEREDIAIIGMGCSIADAKNYEEYWDLIVNKKMTIERCPKHRVDLIRGHFPNTFMDDESKYTKGTFFKDIDMFDRGFFSMDEEEATLMGPGHRMLIQTVYRTLEDAGYLGEKNVGNRTGVFIGNNFSKDMLYSYSNIELENSRFNFRFEHMLGNWSSGLATRLACIFDLKGGAYSVDASCPSSTVAIYNACQAIKNKQCTTAIAGGLMLDMTPIKCFSNSGWIFSHGDEVISRTYDNNSNGGYTGEACGAILLKPLTQAIEDGDRIHGVICGGSFNNNGASGLFTQSSAEDIRKVTISGIKNAHISADDIDFLEGEGYPIKLEEGLELSGLIDGFRSFTDKRQFCGLGSISPNFGYLQAVIGVMQMIKVVMALKKETIPPQCHFIEPTDMVNLMKSPFYVSNVAKKWEKTDNKPRCGATYSYGYGGNNLFMVVQESPGERYTSERKKTELFVLSAASKKSFDEYVDAYIDFLSDDSLKKNFTEICYTASVCRIMRPEYRLAVVAENKDELLESLKNFSLTGASSDKLFYGSSLEKEKSRNKKFFRISPKGKKLSELAKDYCTGTNYLFEELFEGEKVNKCELPPYPFDRVQCWSKKEKMSMRRILEKKRMNGVENRDGKS